MVDRGSLMALRWLQLLRVGFGVKGRFGFVKSCLDRDGFVFIADRS